MKKVIILSLSLLIMTAKVALCQDSQLTIDTHHPDFSVKVKRCVASGKTLILDLTATNTGLDDINRFTLVPILTEAVDDEGNSYRGNIGAKVGNQANYTYQRNAFTDLAMETKLLSNIPVKLSIIIPNFSQEATSIALIEIGVVCPSWNYRVNFRSFTQRLTLRNIPITRK